MVKKSWSTFACLWLESAGLDHTHFIVTLMNMTIHTINTHSLLFLWKGLFPEGPLDNQPPWYTQGKNCTAWSTSCLIRENHVRCNFPLLRCLIWSFEYNTEVILQKILWSHIYHGIIIPRKPCLLLGGDELHTLSLKQCKIFHHSRPNPRQTGNVA